MRESNPRQTLGKRLCYHYTNGPEKEPLFFLRKRRFFSPSLLSLFPLPSHSYQGELGGEEKDDDEDDPEEEEVEEGGVGGGDGLGRFLLSLSF